MKRLFCSLLIGCLSLGLISCSNNTNMSTELSFKKGIYTTTAEGINGPVTIEVSFSENKIDSIEIKEHSESAGISDPAFDRIPTRVIETQSLNVDTVTGCTVTSTALLKAIEDAVSQAGGDVEALKNKEVSSAGSNETIEKTADVIVIGGGGAGLSAAVSALEEGSSVILIEKTAALGGNTILAGGPINAADPEWQETINALPGEDATLEELLGLDESMFVDEYLNTYRTLKGQIEEYLATDRSYLFDSVELHTIQTYLGGLRENLDGEEIYGNYDLVSKLTNNVLDTIEWLADLGVNFREAIAMPVGAMWRRGHKPEEAKGVEFINVLGSTIEEKGGEVLLETTATKLIQENGKIIGVEAENSDGAKVILSANNGVILTTGGFAANTEMVIENNNYWDTIPEDIKTTNASGQMGEGIQMGAEVGAKLVGMEYIQMMPVADPKSGLLFTGLITPPANYIFVNTDGERFVNECESRDVLSEAAFENGGLFYMIADSNIKDLAENTSEEKIQKEIEEGIIIKADTLEELSEKIGVDKDTFLETIEKYNSYVEAGNDPEFNKSSFDLKVEVGPFYATPRMPATHHTMGGLMINTSAEVINEEGNVIEGLFAAGEVTGGIHGGNRLGGNSLSDIFTFGRIAGKSAASKE